MKRRGKDIMFGAVAGSLATLVILGMIIEFGGIIAKVGEEPAIKTEYRLELLNQDSVKIYSESTQQLYVVPVDSIQYILSFDNSEM